MKVTIDIPQENLKQALSLLVLQCPDACDRIPELQKTECVEVTEEDFKEIGVDDEGAWKQVLVALAMMGYGAAMRQKNETEK